MFYRISGKGQATQLTRIGREGGDISGVEAVILAAVRGGATAEAINNVQGIEGKTFIDAMNRNTHPSRQWKQLRSCSRSWS
jgi:hypothetical protein